MAKHARITLCLYADPDQRAVAYDEHRGERLLVEVDAHGWDYGVGDVVKIDGYPYTIDVVHAGIQTPQNYTVAEAVYRGR